MGPVSCLIDPPCCPPGQGVSTAYQTLCEGLWARPCLSPREPHCDRLAFPACHPPHNPSRLDQGRQRSASSRSLPLEGKVWGLPGGFGTGTWILSSHPRRLEEAFGLGLGGWGSQDLGRGEGVGR